MCGICGIIKFGNGEVEDRRIRSMMEKLRHRGPDDEGTYVNGNVGFGFVRLSILDLSQAGHQPMHARDGRYSLIFNGEIYNFIELREELRKYGHRFESDSDTEVLLAAYIEWGEACLDKFNGMFAFAVHDAESGEVFLARDRFGIKPLYYYRDDEQFVFASEIPAILEAGIGREVAPNEQAIFDYLVFNRTDQTTDTFFRDIRKLQHGTHFKINGGEVRETRWYRLNDHIGQPFQSPGEFRELFSSSVGLRLRSDVPVGVCLSGGLDSSSIVSTLLEDYGKEDLNTFSAVYGEGAQGDESEYIAEFRDQLSNMYFTTPTADTLFDDMSNFIEAHGEPVPSTSPYAQFKVMELAKEHVVVTLDGQGADELLAGYHYFFGNYFKELLKELRLLQLAGEGIHYLKLHRSLFAFKSFVYFLLPEAIKTKARVREKGYLDGDFIDEYAADNVIAGQLYESDSLRQALVNHFEFKLEHLLKWEDRNSMWFSLESRVPFLDHRLVEKTLAMPSDMVIHKGNTKHLLREAMKGTLPEKIRTRSDKIGFGTPEDEWFRSPKFQRFTKDLIHSDRFRERGILEVDELDRLHREHLEGKANISKEIWKWINLELWFRKFIDK